MIDEITLYKKEYRVRAYFTRVYAPRSYKNKWVATPAEAEELLAKAEDYYSDYNYLDRIVIESRIVSEWEEC